MSSSTCKKNRDFTLDILRGIAILAVIFTHLPGVPRYNYVTWWPYAFFINMAVPVFMIIMGYCVAMSTEKRSYSWLQMYSLKNILHKSRRYFLPWLPIILLELLVNMIFRGIKYDCKSLFIFAILGGVGPGSYYIPILFQSILIFPLFYLCRKHIFLISFFINIAFELAIAYGWDIPILLYRVCIIRYLFFIGCGMSIYYTRERFFSKTIQVLTTSLGVVYLLYMTFFQDFGRNYPRWWSSMMLVGLYLYFPLRYIILNSIFDKFAENKISRFLSVAGTSSYHIFLIQMVYFFISPYLFTIFNGNLITRVICTVLLAFPVCVAGGIMYCLFEQFLINHWKK